MRRACVIGWPIEHSRSPLIHGYWLQPIRHRRHHTIASRYGPIMRASSLRTLAMRSLLGCNVTVPHKEVAFRVADERTSPRWRSGRKYRLAGWRTTRSANTDTYGYMTHLDPSARRLEKARCTGLVLGAGGAARAIIYGFLSAGVSRVRVSIGRRQRAEALAEHFGPAVKVADWPASARALRGCGSDRQHHDDGHEGRRHPRYRFYRLSMQTAWSQTSSMCRWRRSSWRGARAWTAAVDGLGMLLHQAVPGFERGSASVPKSPKIAGDSSSSTSGPHMLSSGLPARSAWANPPRRHPAPAVSGLRCRRGSPRSTPAESVELVERAFPGTTASGEGRPAKLAAACSRSRRFMRLEAIVHPLVHAAERAVSSGCESPARSRKSRCWRSPCYSRLGRCPVDVASSSAPTRSARAAVDAAGHDGREVGGPAGAPDGGPRQAIPRAFCRGYQQVHPGL